MRARETWSEIVFSLLVARTRISQCFLTLTARRRPTIFPTAPTTPQSKEVASRPIITGAATIVLKRPTPPTPVSALIKRRTVSQPFKIFAARRYFFFQLRPFLPFGFEVLTKPRDLLKAVGLVRGRALAQQFRI